MIFYLISTLFIIFLYIVFSFYNNKLVNINDIGICLILTDFSGKIVSSNFKVFEYFGYNESELKGKNISILMDSGLSDFHSKLLSKYKPKNCNCIIMNNTKRSISVRCKDGSYKLYNIIVSETNKGFTASFQTKVDDNYNELIEQAKVAKFNTVMHEIRNPLFASKEYLSMSIEKINNVDIRRDLKLVLNFYDHIISIINDSLEIDKLENGKIKLKLEPTDLFSLLEELAHLFRAKTNKDVKIIVRASRLKNVLIDKKRLLQIYINLLSNAVRYTDKGFIYLDVTLNKLDNSDYSHLIFSVADTGKGITSEKQNECFNKYNSSESYDIGTGLGLYISKKLSLALHFVVDDIIQQRYSHLFKSLYLESPYVDNDPRRFEISREKVNGSRFTFSLVCKNNFSPDLICSPEVKINESNQEVTEFICYENYKFLIIDDIKINQTFLKRIISKIFPNCNILVCDNGETALSLIDSSLQCVLCDYDFGNDRMNGIEVLKKINKINSKILKILVTGHDEEFFKDKEHTYDFIWGKPPPQKSIIYNTLTQNIKK